MKYELSTKYNINLCNGVNMTVDAVEYDENDIILHTVFLFGVLHEGSKEPCNAVVRIFVKGPMLTVDAKPWMMPWLIDEVIEVYTERDI